MTQKEKQELWIAICGYLPHGVIFDYNEQIVYGFDWLNIQNQILTITNRFSTSIEEVRPYLRPISKMTNKEKDKLLTKLVGKKYKNLFKVRSDGRVVEVDDRTKKTWDSVDGIHFEYVDFCPNTIKTYMEFMYSHHLDIHGLIKKGLALEATKEMYETT